jgi:hypothetical protein
MSVALDPTIAYVGVPGEEEHFAHPAEGGDVCTAISLSPWLCELWPARMRRRESCTWTPRWTSARRSQSAVELTMVTSALPPGSPRPATGTPADAERTGRQGRDRATDFIDQPCLDLPNGRST